MYCHKSIISNPDNNIWINAHAGTGKTYILVHRFIALVLHGTKASNIFCITYTNEAASEIKARIYEIAIILLNTNDIENEILRYIEKCDDSNIRHARGFYEAILIDGMPMVGTIHSVMTSILCGYSDLLHGRRLANSNEISYLHKMIKESILLDIHNQVENYKDHDEHLLMDSLAMIYHAISKDALQKLIIYILEHSDLFFQIDNKDVIERLMVCLNIDSNKTVNRYPQYYRDIIAKISIDDIGLLRDELFDKNSVRYQSIDRWLAMGKEDMISHIHILLDGLLKDGIAPMKRLPKSEKYIKDLYASISESLVLIAKQYHLLMAYHSAIFLRFIIILCADHYNKLKHQHDIYDHGDVLIASYNMMNDENLHNVRYALDKLVHHVIIDEAQDLSPIMWDIVVKIADDFFTGDGQFDTARTIFVVADAKQSIFSFQGADIDVFNQVKAILKKRALSAQLTWEELSLHKSYRSSIKVIDAINRVFHIDNIGGKLGVDSSKPHETILSVDGVFECYPCSSDSNTSNMDVENYTPDKECMDVDKHQWYDMIISIRDKIEELIKEGIKLSDIMIIVRARTIGNNFMHALIYNLRDHGINAHADRLALHEHIIYKDILALCMFGINPNDNLNLAIILRSPLIGMNLNDVCQYTIEANHLSSSLFDIMQNKEPDIYNKLHKFLHYMRSGSIEKAMALILYDVDINARYYNAYQGYYTFFFHGTIDLLMEIADEEFGNLHSIYCRMDSGSEAIKFASHNRTNAIVITAHSSKGLESKVVMIADVGRIGGHKDILYKIDRTNALPNIHDNTLIRRDLSPNRAISEKSNEEEMRLLYVAMTRAKERLYVFGEDSTQNKNWFSIIKEYAGC